jgi:hypothetical protein
MLDCSPAGLASEHLSFFSQNFLASNSIFLKNKNIVDDMRDEAGITYIPAANFLGMFFSEKNKRHTALGVYLKRGFFTWYLRGQCRLVNQLNTVSSYSGVDAMRLSGDVRHSGFVRR